MLSKTLATLPAAFGAGLAGTMVYRALEHAVFARSDIVMYVAFVLIPFLFCVPGWNPRRWQEEHYWFSETGRADQRRMWKRWIVYTVGCLLGYALT